MIPPNLNRKDRVALASDSVKIQTTSRCRTSSKNPIKKVISLLASQGNLMIRNKDHKIQDRDHMIQDEDHRIPDRGTL